MIWQEKRLGDLADIQLGKMLDQKKNRGEYRPYLGNDNVQWNELKLDEIKLMRIQDSETERFRLRPGDLLVCEGGDPGRCALWATDKEIYYQKALHRVRVGSELDPEYLLYYMMHLGTTQAIRQYYTGSSTIKHLPNAAIKRVVIRYPSLPDQKKIAGYLRSYDVLIENNRKQIKLLEEAAQRLYKEWFIDLRFPGHEDAVIDPETGLPEGWQRMPLGKYATFRRGKIITEKQTSPGNIPVVAGGLEPAYYHDKANTVNPVITVSGSGANAGYTRLYTEGIWASDCSYIDASICGEIFFAYESVLTLGNGFKHLQRGSAQPHVYSKSINELEIVLPAAEMLRTYEQLAENIFQRVSTLNSQATYAHEARNRLLPMLLSAERGI